MGPYAAGAVENTGSECCALWLNSLLFAPTILRWCIKIKVVLIMPLGDPSCRGICFLYDPRFLWSWLGSCKVVGELGGKGKRPIRFRKVK